LTYALAAESAGITYKTLNDWMKLGRDSTSGKYFEFYQHIENVMLMGLGNFCSD
jgi:hypothetical protein